MRVKTFSKLPAILAAIFFGALGSQFASGEEIQFVSVTAFSEMQNRLDDIETRMASFEMLGDGGGKAADKGGCYSCGTCTTPGFTADLQLLFLRPFGSDNDYFNTNNQYNAGVRLSGGYVREDGLGARVRWFSYGIDTPDPDGHFDAYYIDLEITDKFQLGCWDGTLAGGVRYAEIDFPGEPGPESEGYAMFGWGPEVGVSLARHLRGNLYLFADGRYSMLFGTEQYDDEDDAWNIAELQLGVEYRRNACGTMQWFARAALDSQYWSAVYNDDEEDVGLVGAAFSFGITR